MNFHFLTFRLLQTTFSTQHGLPILLPQQVQLERFPVRDGGNRFLGENRNPVTVVVVHFFCCKSSYKKSRKDINA